METVVAREFPEYKPSTNKPAAIRRVRRLRKMWEHLNDSLIAMNDKKCNKHVILGKRRKALGWAVHELTYMYKITREELNECGDNNPI